MNVREATSDDIETVVELLLDLLDESTFDSRAVSVPRARRSITHLVDSPLGAVFLLEHEHRIVGAMMAVISPIWWSHGDEAMDMAFYVRPDYRGHGLKLIKAYEAWARGFSSVQAIYMNVSVGGVARAEQLAERLNYERQGAFFRKEVTQ